jgi:Fur family transcriptional regulator, ferric uptake regulator
VTPAAQTKAPDFPGLLARKGVRATQRRVEVLEELARERDDLTAQALWHRLRDRGSPAGLATVYRTLSLLSETGVIDTLSHHGGEQCYRLCGDHHHHHLLCSACHRVVEVGQCDLGGWLDDVAARYGFVATAHQIEITGICSSCR